MSSEAARAVGDVRTSATAGLGNMLGQLGLSAYETGVCQEMDAAKTALTYEPTLARLIFGTGATEQNQQQVGISNALAELARVEQSPYAPISALSSAVPQGADYPQYSPSPAGGIIGGLASLLTAPIRGSGLGALLGIV